MTPSAREFAWKVRGSVWERDLAEELRPRPEGEKLAFINELLAANPIVAPDLARKTLSEGASFQGLLDRALTEADASSIRFWLEALVPRLGFRRSVAHLRSRAPLNPVGFEKARYWLPLFAKLPGYFEVDDKAISPV